MKIRLKYSKINNYNLLLGLLYLMPIVDSISGLFHDIYPVGQIYRIIYFAYMIFLLMGNSRKIARRLMIALFAFLLIQTFVSVSGGYVVKSIQDTIKLFTPILMISLFQNLLSKGRIRGESFFHLFEVWSILYPLLIIVPSALGINTYAYNDSVGWKGFFFAINEISFIISSLVIYRFYKLSQEINMRNLGLLGLSVICLIGMGTKTGYASVAVGIIALGIFFLKEKVASKKLRIIGISFLVVIVVFLVRDRVVEMTTSIFERWLYQRQISYSTTDFLFSMRLRRIGTAFSEFLEGFHLLFGWGFGGELAGKPNIEMDFLDLLFRTGLFGCIYVVGFYFQKIKKILGKSMWSTLIVIWSFALAFGAGYVLFYGQSGMMLALNIIISSLIVESIKKKKGENKDESNRKQNMYISSYV